ncbi:DHS-like NAD/FAD-binding domain-containing protein [Lentinula aff. detonsa]|uniref:DHS-like NAD/FAD-binding domain-containing protein n=1 Tax=Lentinula aff. detonsa TaxID=2804958 RepID=A0AA38KDX0_9AGAR|nr:DHS-like NAD/FAD-binding domain-containing protein [Lentinula aff. detonsa]
MTLFLPLEESTIPTSIPPFVIKSSEPTAQVAKVIKAILKAKRIVVICGAGISVQAGIPDFRSSEGLFQTLKRDNPKDVLSSGKDLFDASVFNTEHKTALFCQMISQLSDLSKAAEPTAFHHLLRALDSNGRLLRIYTQNIDAIESKSGLSFGIPEFKDKRSKPRNTTFLEVGDPGPSTAANRTPRCIPLHGTLQRVHCQICTHSFPLSDYLPSLAAGVPPECPECTSLERTRQLVGKRARGIGKLRPSVVLYNEAHKDGEGVGEVVQKDLIGSKGRSGADLLLVVGTSLRVPGTKRMVREFSKAVHSRGSSSKESTPGSDEQVPQQQLQQPFKTVYMNLDFPVPTREWEGVFDAWVQGDAQAFAQMLQEELDKELHAKEIAIEKRKKKEEELALAALSGLTPVKHKPKAKTKTKEESPAKKRKVLAGEDHTMQRKKLVVEVPSYSHIFSQSYLGHPPPRTSRPLSPVSPSRLTLRIPPRPRPQTVSPISLYPAQSSLPPLPLSTPVKKSSSLGRPPPTPDHTPPRAYSPRYRTLTAIHRLEHSSSASHAQHHRLPSELNSSTSTSGEESRIDLGIRAPVGKHTWHDGTRSEEGAWKGAYYLPFPLPASRSSCLPLGDRDASTMDMADFRDRLGTSCLRTTHVEVGDGGCQ